MKRSILKPFACFLIIILSVSCTVPNKVRTTLSTKKLPELKTIGLVTAAIPPMVKTVVPIIDAAAFNAKVNSIADQIMDAQKMRINQFRETIAKDLEKYFKASVIFGPALQQNPKIKDILANNNFIANLQLDDNNFPQILIASGDINPFPFENGKIGQFLSDKNNYQSYAKSVCTKLGTDAIAVCYTNLKGIDSKAFGIKGSVALSSTIYIFDKEGEIIVSGTYTSTPVMMGGKDIADYMMLLDQFTTVSGMIVNQMAIDYFMPKK